MVQGTLLQQSEFSVHSWPMNAQSGPPPPVPVPPSGGGSSPPQVPWVEPGVRWQRIPAQQSASVVQTPPDSTQLGPQINGGSLLARFGRQGRPQQSALDAQASPALEPPWEQSPASEQRGMPRLSCWQTVGSLFTLPAQQLFSALQELVASLQMAPEPRHALPLSQRPTGAPFSMTQVTDPLPGRPGPLQQSVSVVQTSPVGRQPLGGWQIITPVGP